MRESISANGIPAACLIWLNTFRKSPWTGCRSDQGLCMTHQYDPRDSPRHYKNLLAVSEPFRVILRPSLELTFGGCIVLTYHFQGNFGRRQPRPRRTTAAIARAAASLIPPIIGDQDQGVTQSERIGVTGRSGAYFCWH